MVMIVSSANAIGVTLLHVDEQVLDTREWHKTGAYRLGIDIIVAARTP